MEQIGTVYVDAGMVWVGDPCYILGQDASHPTPEWSDFCDRLDRGGFFKPGAQHVQPFGDGIGFGVTSGYGDGEYPVYIEKARDGTVKRLIVEFDSDDGDNDNEW